MRYNKLMLGGNLTKDPKFKEGNGDKKDFCGITIAINSWRKDAPAIFVDAVAYGRVAETINKHFSKGDKIFVEGKVEQPGIWTPEGGEPRGTVRMTIDSFEFVGGGQESSGSAPAEQSKPAPKSQAPKTQAAPPVSDSSDDYEDEIPF